MATETPIRVVAEAHIKPQHRDDLLALLGALTDGTRAEAGNLSYTVLADANDADHILFLEEWSNRAAFDAHLQAPHFIRYASASDPLLQDAPRIIVAEPLGN